jgi:hypothetical protein
MHTPRLSSASSASASSTRSFEGATDTAGAASTALTAPATPAAGTGAAATAGAAGVAPVTAMAGEWAEGGEDEAGVVVAPVSVADGGDGDVAVAEPIGRDGCRVDAAAEVEAGDAADAVAMGGGGSGGGGSSEWMLLGRTRTTRTGVLRRFCESARRADGDGTASALSSLVRACDGAGAGAGDGAGETMVTCTGAECSGGEGAGDTARAMALAPGTRMAKSRGTTRCTVHVTPPICSIKSRYTTLDSGTRGNSGIGSKNRIRRIEPVTPKKNMNQIMRCQMCSCCATLCRSCTWNFTCKTHVRRRTAAQTTHHTKELQMRVRYQRQIESQKAVRQEL